MPTTDRIAFQVIPPGAPQCCGATDVDAASLCFERRDADRLSPRALEALFARSGGGEAACLPARGTVSGPPCAADTDCYFRDDGGDGGDGGGTRQDVPHFGIPVFPGALSWLLV